MKGWIFSLLCLATFTVAIPVSKAQISYTPGTIGYLYEDCQKAVQVNTIEEFETSWCGTFIRGYLIGAYMASMKNHHKTNYYEAKPNCVDAAKEEREHIRTAHSCPHLRHLLGKAKNPANIIKGLPIWISWAEKRNPDILNQYISPHINGVVNSVDFCKYVIEEKFDTNPFPINPDLEKIDTDDWEKIAKKIRPENFESTECSSDKIRNMNERQFAENSCGAYGSGLFAGFYFTDKPILNKNPECVEDIDAIRKDEIAAREMCLPDNLPISKIYQMLKKQKITNFCTK